jgi:hypothetical protein
MNIKISIYTELILEVLGKCFHTHMSDIYAIYCVNPTKFRVYTQPVA